MTEQEETEPEEIWPPKLSEEEARLQRALHRMHEGGLPESFGSMLYSGPFASRRFKTKEEALTAERAEIEAERAALGERAEDSLTARDAAATRKALALLNERLALLEAELKTRKGQTQYEPIQTANQFKQAMAHEARAGMTASSIEELQEAVAALVQQGIYEGVAISLQGIIDAQAPLATTRKPTYKEVLARWEAEKAAHRSQRITLKDICTEMGANYASVLALKSRYAKPKKRR